MKKREKIQKPLTIEYKTNASAIPFHNSVSQVKAISGPVGSGKSSICCWEIFFACKEARVPLRILILRETQRQLTDTTLRTWLEWFGPMSEWRKGEDRIYLTVENCDGDELTHEIDMRQARRAEEASQFMSSEYAIIWLEEVVPAYQTGSGTMGMGLPKEIFDIAIMRQRQKGAHRLHILVSFNPPNKFHWVYQEFFQQGTERLEEYQARHEAKDYALFRQPAFENEKNLPPGYYKKLLERLSPDIARRFVYGEPVTMYPGKRVYDQCREHIHIRDQLAVQPDVPLVIAFDFGLTPVALIAQLLASSRLLVHRELQLWNAGVERLAEELVAELNEPPFKGLEWRCWGDPAGAAKSQTDERTCFGILASKGFSVMPGAIDFAARFNAITQRLERTVDGEPAVLISRDGCPILVEGMLGGYRYLQLRDGRIDHKPLKNEFSHVCNAFEYMCSGEYNILTGGRKQEAKKEPKLPVYDPFSPAPSRGAGGWMSR